MKFSQAIESCHLFLKAREGTTTCCFVFVTLLLAPALAAAQVQLPSGSQVFAATAASNSALPNTPSASAAANSPSFGEALGNIGRTIGEDELHIIKAPFNKSALKWDALVLGATAVLIANDESVLYQVPVRWHQTSLNISDAGVYGSAAIVGGIYLTGLITENPHEQEVGIRTGEATIDSVILYAALKAILQRQRPYTGVGEGKFFAGNWSNGSFPSGHATFAWTIASSVAHQYHSIPLDVLMYAVATTVSTTRVTAGQHYPADVFVGSILGYLIGDYVAHKPQSGFPIRGESKVKRMPIAILQHVTIGAE